MGERASSSASTNVYLGVLLLMTPSTVTSSEYKDVCAARHHIVSRLIVAQTLFADPKATLKPNIFRFLTFQSRQASGSLQNEPSFALGNRPQPKTSMRETPADDASRTTPLRPYAKNNATVAGFEQGLRPKCALLGNGPQVC